MADATCRIRARMIGLWGEFYAWLAEQYAFEAEFTPGEPQFCPAHHGESGQAFRFYADAEITGGGICNSCPHVRAADGVGLVAGWLFDRSRAGGSSQRSRPISTNGVPPSAPEKAPADLGQAVKQACALIEEWAAPDVPDTASDIVAQRLSEWVLSVRPDIAVAYLTSRGIPITAERLPAAVRATAGELRALIRTRDAIPATYHAIRLDAQHHRLLGREAKRTAGVERTVSLSGSYVDLSRLIPGGGQPTRLLIAEGVETALASEHIYRSATEAKGPLRLHALVGSTSKLRRYRVPEGIRDIIIFADNDHTLPGTHEAAQQLAESAGVRVQVAVAPATPRHPKPDWLDALTERGLGEAAALMCVALPDTSEGASPATAPDESSETRTAAESIRENPSTGRIQISLPVVTDPDLFTVLNRLIHEQPPQWYWHLIEGTPVLVSPSGAHRPVAAYDAVSWVSERVESYNSRGEATGTPAQRVTAWFNTPKTQAWLREHLRPLSGVLHAPRLMRAYNEDGTYRWVFRTEPGYDPQTRTVLYLPEDEKNALERARGAFDDFMSGGIGNTIHGLREILGQTLFDLLLDFDFDSNASRAAAVAAIITPMFAAAAENVPLFLIDAPQRGSGKTTFAMLATMIWGRPFQFGFPKNDDAEFEKRLGSAFRGDTPLVVIDNISHRLVSDTLARVLTDRQNAKIRVLGTNAVTAAPLGLVFYATGSNLEVQEEIKRRAVPIRLEPKLLDPAMRTSFVHPDLLSYTSGRAIGIRGMLYSCMMAWCEHYRDTPADYPSMRRDGLPLFAGFSDWAAMLDSFISAFLPWFHNGFLENRAQWICDGDAQTQSTQEFIDTWWEMFNDTIVRASDLAQRVLPEAPVVADGRGGGNGTMQNLSRAVAKFVGGIRARRFRANAPSGASTVIEVQVLPRQFDNRRKGYRLAVVAEHSSAPQEPATLKSIGPATQGGGPSQGTAPLQGDAEAATQ